MRNVFVGPTGTLADGLRILVIVVTFPNAEGKTDLLEIVGAADFLGLPLGGRESRQKHGRQNRDDRDDDEQFDERERFLLLFHNYCYVLRLCFCIRGQAANFIGISTTVKRISKMFFSNVNAKGKTAGESKKTQ